MTVTRRNIYHTLSLIKLIIGLVVLVIVYQYIDPFQDPETWVIIWSIGLLFLVRGTSYFIFYFAGLRRSDHKIQLIASHAYKLSLLVALFFLTNIVFLVVEFWTAAHSLIALMIFAAVYWLIFHKPLPEQHTSIDFLSRGRSTEQDEDQENDEYGDLIDKNNE